MSTSDYKNLRKMFWNHLWARENHLLFGETSQANGKCTYARRRKVEIFQLEMVLSNKSKDIREKFTLTLTSVRRYHGVYERNLQLYR
jgi:hypothetical protein